MKDRTYLPLLLLLPLSALLLFLIRESQVAGAFGFPLDDSWIFWVFAKNLATGNGFSFNPGQAVLGTTSLLWTLVLAGSYLVTQHVVLISKFWGVVLFLFSILLTYRICLFYTNREKTAFFGVMTFALAPALIFGALSGMETSLATFLFCLALFLHLQEMKKKRRIYLAPIFGALCFMARPELVTVYPLLLIHDYLRLRRGDDESSRQAGKAAVLRRVLTFILVLLPPLTFTYVLTGSFLPNTFAAKTLDSGLVWAISHGNVDELLVTLTLNPFIWAGCMLLILVWSNILWAFFWCRGFVLSLFNKDRFIYPAIFLVIPMVRGAIAPLGNPFSSEHRYVSFLFPLLAVFFVQGWEGLENSTRGKTPDVSWRKWFYVAAGISLIPALVFYANPLVKKDLLVSLLSKYYFPAVQLKSSLLDFCDFRFVFWFVVIFMAGVSLIGTTKFLRSRPRGKNLVYLVLISGMFLQAGFLFNRGQRYALSVKNINQMQVHLGKWMNRNIAQGSLVAINDAGAIKFFGDRRCLDLEGLVSPQIIPYKLLSRDSYLVFLNRNRPDYFIIFPLWYPTVYSYMGLWKNVLYEVELKDNIACGGGGHMIVAKPDWELFDSTFEDSKLLNMKPYLPAKSLLRRWYVAQERQELWPDWKVYERKGREEEKKREFQEAENFYRKAESYDPQDQNFYLMLAVFYHNRGDQAKAELAFRKAQEYQFFPFPDYRPMVGM